MPSPDPVELASYGHALAALLFSVLSAALVRNTHQQPRGRGEAWALVAAVGTTAVWGWLEFAASGWTAPWLPVAARTLDIARYAAWFGLLWWLLAPRRGLASWPFRLMVGLGAGLVAAMLATLVGEPEPLADGAVASRGARGLPLAAAVYGLFLIEQLFRNQKDSARWSAKPLCLGLACIFGFDVYMYTEAFLAGQPDADALTIRSFVHAIAAPLFYISMRRQAHWAARVQLSRDLVLYSASLILAGAYLILMAAAGYYVRYLGGTWGRPLQIVVVVAGAVLLVGLAVSGSLRAWLKVFLGKNFFRYRYDYRQEWLRFTGTLAGGGAPQQVGEQVIKGLADLLECPGGALWGLDTDGADLVQTHRWNTPAGNQREPLHSPFCHFLLSTGWVLEIDDVKSAPGRYPGLSLPAWLDEVPNAWLIVSLPLADRLIGFVVLSRPRARIALNWEVTDLLKTASRQAASFLGQQQATEALLEARKFDAFNRMSAFVVHDLKNIVTQLSLMMRNAQRLRDNPEFQQDMLITVESSLEKMRQLMVQLREGEPGKEGQSGVDLVPVVKRLEAMAAARGRSIGVEIQSRVSTRGQEARLERVLGHMVHNALDATPASGTVVVRLSRHSGQAKIVIEDNGMGMSSEFIKDRLFRPFQTTKVNGMGIGSYESQQYIRELGGHVHVDSTVGQGTSITILLPLLDASRDTDLRSPVVQ
ncbi:XrtA/PEP-CTERM system histidine kinase PrsK [Ideonella sp. A 288]|uniref:XrtA/PEP-CTERM system histidine kinase PrsK n=1 Tax=Ideonella sp. A 288 TaxID=1962181 RepID=UPI000B4B45FD|nr:XrtA/PEP-CTERM system histidine kinase PrsK [Ideonella sp. A 288]